MPSATTPTESSGERHAANIVDRLFLVATVAAIVTIVVLGRGLTFSTLGDEWTFIETRSLSDPSTWLPAHNEHWLTTFVLLFRSMFEVVGFRSYLPYLVVLAVLHAIVAAGVYRLVREQTRPWIALGLLVPFLLFGAGWENLFIFFQASVLMAVAAGLWALVALRSGRERHALIAAILLVIAVMSVAAGVLFLVVSSVELIVAKRLRHLIAVLPAAIAYMYWYAFVGAHPVGGQSNELVPETALAIVTFMALELLHAIGAFLGGGIGSGVLGTMLLLVGLATVATRDPKRLATAAVLGPATGLFVGLMLIAVGRRHLGSEAAAYGRYLYVWATLMLPLAAALIGRPTFPISRRVRRWAIVSCILFVELSLVGSLGQLRSGLAGAQARSDALRAVVGVELGPLRAQISPTRSVYFVPPVGCLAALVERFGDPTTDLWFPGVIPRPNPQLEADARRALLGQDSPLQVEEVICSPEDLAGLS